MGARVVPGKGAESVPLPANAGEPAETQTSQSDFLQRLFCALEQENIRYCVLQRGDALLQELNTDHDVDLAVHPQDASKLPFVWQALSEQGYRPIHCLNHAVNSYAFVFAWFEEHTLRSVMVDVALDHRQSGLIWKSARELVAGRQKLGNFWVADPATEFAYLLVKKMLKGPTKVWREQRFRVLVERLGRPQAEKIVTDLFGEKWKGQVLEACVSGSPGPILSRLRRRFLWVRLARNPFNMVRYGVADGLQLLRRWLQPTGASLVFLGPENQPKNAISARLVEVVTPAFGSSKVYWSLSTKVPRKGVEAPDTGLQGGPHPRPLRSTLHLLQSFFHSWLDYALRLRPLLVRTGLVVLDRCIQERFIERISRQHMGPIWLEQVFCRLAPQPDVIFFLEPGEESECPGERVGSRIKLGLVRGGRAQPTRYAPNVRTLHTRQGIEQAVREGAGALLEYLVQRFRRRQGRWVLSGE